MRLFDHLTSTPAVLGNPTVVAGVGVTTCATRYAKHDASFTDITDLIVKLSKPEPDTLWKGDPLETKGNSKYIRTGKGSVVKMWQADDDVKEERRKYFCHGFALGTYQKYKGTPITQQGLKTILDEEFILVEMGKQMPGDVAAWFKGGTLMHTAIYINTKIPDRAQIKLVDISEQKMPNSPGNLFDLTGRAPNHEILHMFRDGKSQGTLNSIDVLSRLQAKDEISCGQWRFRIVDVPPLEDGFHSKNGPQMLYYDTLSYLNSQYDPDLFRYFRKKS